MNGEDGAGLSPIELTTKRESQTTDPKTALPTERYLESLLGLVPGFRHELRGRLNSALLNLEVAKRSLDKGDIDKALASIERARAENQRLSQELPGFLNWFADQRLERSIEELKREVDTLISPALRRYGVRVESFQVAEECSGSKLSSGECQRVLIALVELASCIPPTESGLHLLHLSARRDGSAARLEISTEPQIDRSILEQIVNQMRPDPVWLELDDHQFHLSLELV